MIRIYSRKMEMSLEREFFMCTVFYLTLHFFWVQILFWGSKAQRWIAVIICFSRFFAKFEALKCFSSIKVVGMILDALCSSSGICSYFWLTLVFIPFDYISFHYFLFFYFSFLFLVMWLFLQYILYRILFFP